MQKEEISYDRTIYKSYMKIAAVQGGSFDERIILMNKVDGALFCEKCYENGIGQYWYDITGKQALDYYCSVGSVGKDFLLNLLLCVCSLYEQLEWNLIDERCLKLEPEMIYVSHSGEAVSFVLYPQTEEKSAFVNLVNLMEYLLTKLDHSQKDFVIWIYDMYERMKNEEYGIAEVKGSILEKRIEELSEPRLETTEWAYPSEESLCGVDEGEILSEDEEGWDMKQKEILPEIWKKIQEALAPLKKDKRKESPSLVVYPEENEEEEEITIHKTICMTMDKMHARGVLVYEGLEQYEDFDIGKEMCAIGKSHRVRMQIEKDTISQFHAKVDYQEGIYFIEDMNSTNGTYVNGELLSYKEKRALEPGDSIQFADVRYRFW